MAVTRVTQNQIFQTTRNILQQQTRSLLKAQEIMATQKRINRLSDDPVGAGRVFAMRAQLSQTLQFQRNIDRATTLAESYDTALSQVNDILTRARELVTSQSNTATTSDATREAAAIELITLREQLVNISNNRIGGQYIFAGHLDNDPPFEGATVATAAGGGNTGTGAVDSATVANTVELTLDNYQIVFTGPGTYDVVNVDDGITVVTGAAYTPGGTISFDGIEVEISGAPAAGDTFDVNVTPPGNYVGDNGQVRYEIEQNVLNTVNLTGDEVFLGVGVTNGENIFDMFNDIVEALRNNDEAGIVGTLERIDRSQDQVVNSQAVIGARENLYDTTMTRLQDLEINLQSLISSIEDIDVAEAATNFTIAENAYQASLSAAGRMIQPSLMDFLG